MKLAELHPTGFVNNANIVLSTVYRLQVSSDLLHQFVPDTLKALF